MIRKLTVTAGGALALTLAAAGAPAQSLIEVARQEKTRREAIAPEDRARVYTNDDLRDSGGLTIGALPAAGAAPAADAGSGRAGHGVGGGDAAAGPEAGESLDENAWRTRLTAARQARARAELMASALQNRADGLWAQFTATDDPAQRSEVQRQRNEALAELRRTQAETERLEQEIHDAHEEARRAGVPPGWLR